MINADVNRYGATQNKATYAVRSEQRTAAGGSTPNISASRTVNPAFTLTLSPAAKAALDTPKNDDGARFTSTSTMRDMPPMQPMLDMSDELAASNQRIEARLAAWTRFSELFSEKGEDKGNYILAVYFKEMLPINQATYNRVLNTKPVPAVELKNKEKEAVLDKARDLGLPVGGSFNIMFSEGEIMYAIKSDGIVTKHDNKIPTSEEEKQRYLETLKNRIDLGRTDLTDYERRSAVRDKELAELSATLGININI